MYKVLFIGLAGLVGTLARYGLSLWIDQRWGSALPVGTIVVNLAGCLAMGFLFYAMQERFAIDPVVRLSILVGFLGGFTTFSSYAIQSVNLLQEGQIVLAGVNILVSNVVGLTLTWVGYVIARSL